MGHVRALRPVTDTPLTDNPNPGFTRIAPTTSWAMMLGWIAKGNDEIAPGQSIHLKWLSRVAPRLIFAS